MTVDDMKRERARRAAELEAAETLMVRTSTLQLDQQKTVDRLRCQVQLWDDLLSWEHGEDPRAPL